MKKSDFGVISVIYVIALVFFVMTLDLPEETRTYPLGLIVALALLNTLYMVHQVWKWLKTRHIENDIHILFKDFQPKQFLFVLVGCVVYLVMMYYLGYYISIVVYLLGTLLFLKVPKWQIALTTVGLMVLIFGVFTLFLNVPLPHGVLLS